MRRIALALLMAAGMAMPVRAGSYDNLNAGIQLYNLGQWNAAILQLDKALAAGDLVPSLKFVAHFDRARSHLSLAHFDEAIRDYSDSLALRPGEAQVLIDRSLAYLNIGKLDQAAADLDAVIAARPLMAGPYGIRARVNIQRRRIDKSREDMKTVLALLPENAKRGTGIGILNWELGQVDDAGENFAYEASHGPNSRYAWLWYALTELRRGKEIPRRAVPDFDAKAWPAPIIRFFLGETSRDAVFSAAEQGEAGQVRGQVCEANFYIGEWLLQRHDPAGARPLIIKAASECPTGFIEWSPAQTALAGLQ